MINEEKFKLTHISSNQEIYATLKELGGSNLKNIKHYKNFKLPKSIKPFLNKDYQEAWDLIGWRGNFKRWANTV